VRLGGSVVAHLLLSGDRKWKKSAVPNPDAVRQADAEPVRTKRIIFIRHGESDWNEVRAPHLLHLRSPICLSLSLYISDVSELS
jgi:hypothetical protein